VFVHLLVEFSETGSISVWDDYQSFSGRLSKQFDFSERMTTLRISQYITIIYALLYLIYERTDWNVLRSKIPDVSFVLAACYVLLFLHRNPHLCRI
jgi:hypothetical protein